MKRQLTISIIIPAYNEERHLGACLQAIAQQTVRPDEVIVIDNNSSDGTAAVAQSFPFVRVIHESKQGLYYARQTGMQAATGDILCRIDADTIVEGNWVSVVHGIFHDSETMAATGPVGYHDAPLPRFVRWAEDILLIGAQRLGYRFLMGCNMAVRRSAWLSVADEVCNEPYILEDIDIATHLRLRGMVPVYVSGMKSMVSARRLLDSLSDFVRYISGHTRTLALHGESSLGAVYSEVAFIVVYVLFRPIVVAFNPESRRFDLRRLLQKPQCRPDPMATGCPVAQAAQRAVEYD